ncbi:MAG: hypothetical protein ABIZ57_08315 [Candidatus Limnocylindria bacterium]
MAIVQLEHSISSFEMWKAAFDRDPIRRQESGVLRYRIYRPVDEPNFIAVDLEFDDVPQAEAFRVSLEDLWRSPQAAPALGGATPRVRIVETVESREY